MPGWFRDAEAYRDNKTKLSVKEMLEKLRKGMRSCGSTPAGSSRISAAVGAEPLDHR